MFKKLKFIILIVTCLVGGVVAGIFYDRNFNSCKDIYAYINDRLVCNSEYVIKKHGYSELKDRLNEFIQSKDYSGEASEISVYFRDLEDGPTLGINEHTFFSPASLFKVPYLITYLKLAEEEPALLDKKLVFRIEGKDPNESQLLHPLKTIDENIPYTISEILEKMIIYSDNRSVKVLANYLEQISPENDLFYETIYSIGIIAKDGREDDSITVKSYASLFTLLYNASFLNNEMSERALTLLAKTDFNQGIKSGVPAPIEISHKFGERYDLSKNTRQFHDCGIIYYPKNPYLLCIMTRGNDFDKLIGIISSISKMFYEEVDSRRI